MHQWRVSLHRWRRLSRPEQRTVLAACLWLSLITPSLKWAGLGTTMRLLRKLCRAGRAGMGTVPAEVAGSTARLVTAVARQHPFRPVCLTQSVTLWFLLARKGIDSVVRIGVTKDAADFSAHAWVEVNGQVFLDAPDVTNRFSVIV